MKELIPLIIFVFLFSCGSDESANSITGGINVFVESGNNIKISGAYVELHPSGESGITNQNGLITFLGLPIDEYTATASEPDFGNGQKTVLIEEGLISSITIILNPENDEPSIAIISPEENAQYGDQSIIEIALIVSDDQSVYELPVKCSSNLDGHLTNTFTNSDGEALLSIQDLSLGQHLLNIEVSDKLGLKVTKDLSIQVVAGPELPSLVSVRSDFDGIELQWEPNLDVDFSKYEILRSFENQDYEIIHSTSNASTISFLDTDVDFGMEYFYKIRATNSNSIFAESLIKSSVFLYAAIDLFNNDIAKMMMHPQTGKLICLDVQQEELLFIDIEDREIDRRTSLNNAPTDFAIDATGLSMYVALNGINQVVKVNTISGLVENNIVLQDDHIWGIGEYPYRIACNSETDFFTVATERSKIYYIKVSNGRSVANLPNCCDDSGILAHKNSHYIYFTEDTGNGGRTYKYERSTMYSNLVPLDESERYYSYSGRDYPMSGDGKFIFYSNAKLPVNELTKEIGEFSEPIIACNYDGSLVAGENFIHNGNTFEEIEELPFTSHVKVFEEEKEIILMWNQERSKLIMKRY